MSITEWSEKIKLSSGWGLVALLLLTNIASFGLGKLAAIEGEREPVRWEQSLVGEGEGVAAPELTAPVAPAAVAAGAYVASKSGSKYHLPWCSGAQRIKEANKIYFASKEEAERAGYTPAANCPGI